MGGMRGLRVAALVAGGGVGLSGGMWGLLSGQAKKARAIIGLPAAEPFNGDGVYFPDGSGPHVHIGEALTFALLGDSLAAGLGAEEPRALPGVRLARGLAEESGQPVRLTTYAIVGSTTKTLIAQVDAALTDPPDVALVIVGGNDVTAATLVRTSAALLGDQVRRFTAAGTSVVVGTCPDLAIVLPIPQPLRSIASNWSGALARAQRVQVRAAGGRVVALGDLLTRDFLASPDEMFSSDRFHPSGAGYELAANVMLPPLCAEAGIW